MSDWEHGRYRYQPKRPPPEHGIRIAKAGTTWWGQRWLDALEHVLGGDAKRLGRGKSYARAGRAHDLVVKGGVVTAKVTGSRPQPYDVRVELSQLGPEQWRAAIAGMAARAQFSAALLAGQMPTAIDDVFVAAGGSLFPTERAHLVTSCSCPDWGDPCKHVAATHFVLGEALDRDPFLLFELRGKTQEQVREALRAARAGEPSRAGEPEATRGAEGEREDEVARVTLQVSAADYDRAPASLPALEFRFDEPRAEGALLRQLGAPPTWRSAESPAAAFEEWIAEAAQAARRLALGEDLGAMDEAAPARVEPAPGERASSREPGSRRSAATKKTTAKKKAAKKPTAMKRPSGGRAKKATTKPAKKAAQRPSKRGARALAPSRGRRLAR